MNIDTLKRTDGSFRPAMASDVVRMLDADHVTHLQTDRGTVCVRPGRSFLDVPGWWIDFNPPAHRGRDGYVGRFYPEPDGDGWGEPVQAVLLFLNGRIALTREDLDAICFPRYTAPSYSAFALAKTMAFDIKEAEKLRERTAEAIEARRFRGNITPSYRRFIELCARDVIAYARRYRCPLIEAVDDWEGNGPEGQFGLQRHERLDVCRYLEINPHTGEPMRSRSIWTGSESAR